MKQLEKIVKSKIVFFYNTKYNCEKVFDSFNQIENDIHGKISGYVKLKKSISPVWYDSTYELNVLKKLDKCSFVKKIARLNLY